LYQNVEHFAVLVNRTPQILRPATDLEKDVVEMPTIARATATRAHL
jgi:hypothetical protein